MLCNWCRRQIRHAIVTDIRKREEEKRKLKEEMTKIWTPEREKLLGTVEQALKNNPSTEYEMDDGWIRTVDELKYWESIAREIDTIITYIVNHYASWNVMPKISRWKDIDEKYREYLKRDPSPYTYKKNLLTAGEQNFVVANPNKNYMNVQTCKEALNTYLNDGTKYFMTFDGEIDNFGISD